MYLLISIISACTVVLFAYAVFQHCKPHFNSTLYSVKGTQKNTLTSIILKLRNTYNAFTLWMNCKRVVQDEVSFERDLLPHLSEILNIVLGDKIPPTIEESPIKPFIADMNKMYQRYPTYCKRFLFLQGKEKFLIGLYDTRNNTVMSPIYFASNSVDNRVKNELGDDFMLFIG